MYCPAHFSNANTAELFALIDTVSVGTLISAGPSGLMAAEVPLLRQPEPPRLWGHLARVNPQLAEMAALDQVLVHFSGPSAYISPNWYTDPGQVPTWNFVTVQVRGKAILHEDPEEVRDIVARLSARHEADFETPWLMEKVEPRRLESMLRAIVGFHIEIEDIRGKYKLSQNRSAADLQGAIAGLTASGRHELAAMMREANDRNQAGEPCEQ